jgi:phosphohistidine phosphatase
MMRLILMRHAKSSWSDPAQPDIDRPLNKRGQRDAPEIGRWLHEKGYRPEKALVSSAVRTKETWSKLAETMGSCPAEFQERLYHATAATMLHALRAADGCSCVLMLGHQPGIGEFADRLLAEPPADPEFQKYPTSAVSVIEFPCDRWQEVDWRSGKLTDFIAPRSL